MNRDEIRNDSKSEVTLDDYIIPAKITAFCEQYIPQDRWTESCDVYNDERLRVYFKAVVCPCGDPLSIYIKELADRGFTMHNDESGEPVIYCKSK